MTKLKTAAKIPKMAKKDQNSEFGQIGRKVQKRHKNPIGQTCQNGQKG